MCAFSNLLHHGFQATWHSRRTIPSSPCSRRTDSSRAWSRTHEKVAFSDVSREFVAKAAFVCCHYEFVGGVYLEIILFVCMCRVMKDYLNSPWSRSTVLPAAAVLAPLPHLAPRLYISNTRSLLLIGVLCTLCTGPR